MAKSLEEMIRDLHTRGVLTHLSIVSVAGGYSATFASVHGNSMETHRDPVTAMQMAIVAAPKGRARVTKPTKTEHAGPVHDHTGHPDPHDNDMDFG